ncbi:LysM peptidoglycan-binding domain-containing protein [Agromyces bauzanensis]
MSAAIVSRGFGTSGRPRTAEVPASTPTPAPTRLRLTRRGRVVFTALGSLPFVIWAFVAILGSGGAAADIGAQLGARTFEYVTVHQGDSLWDIAESIAPQGDPRVVIDEIMRLNGLDEASLEPGQRLALPVVP